MIEKYILEARWLDKINRCKKSSIVGVYTDLDKMEEVKRELLDKEKKYNLVFSVGTTWDFA
jgi:hypothetical protein